MRFITIGILLIGSFTFGQLRIKEADFSVDYHATKLGIQFGSKQIYNVTANDATTSTNIPMEIDGRFANSYFLNHLHPAQIIKVNYDILENGSVISHTNYLATPSDSTGEINIYFNHPVDTSYSQGHDAVNLGNTLEDKLITYINACHATLDIAIYNSGAPSAASGIAGAINAAYNRGVQVRIIYDGSTSSQMIPLLNPAIPRLASPDDVAYGIMHNKFAIFDANDPNANIPVVWTGSTNWTIAQIDGPDRNSAIVIQDQALAQVYKIEFDEMWGGTTALPDLANSKFGPNKTNNTPHHLVIGGKIVDSYFSPSDGTNSKIIAAINSANSDIDIATMLVTRSDIKNALLNKYNSGLTNINFVNDNQNPTSNQFPTIQAAILPNHAVTYTGNGIMHHKFMVVDNFNPSSDPLVVVGSHNWSTSAETKNDENLLIVHDAAATNQYYQAFAWLYQQAAGEIVLRTENPAQASGWQVYPNPSKGIFTIGNAIVASLSNAIVVVSDVFGKTVYTAAHGVFSSTMIDLSNQANGIYFITVQAADCHFHYKILKD